MRIDEKWIRAHLPVDCVDEPCCAQQGLFFHTVKFSQRFFIQTDNFVQALLFCHFFHDTF